MENPCLTFVTPTLLAGDKSLTDTVIHEVRGAAVALAGEQGDPCRLLAWFSPPPPPSLPC